MNRYLTSVSNFVDILAQEMLDQASQSQAESTDLSNEITIETTSQTSASPLTACTGNKEHTNVILKKGKQLRCMWCSRVNLIERKTTLKCLECGKGFCRDENNGLSCWSHHVALGGVPKSPRYGTKKRKLNECMAAV